MVTRIVLVLLVVLLVLGGIGETFSSIGNHLTQIEQVIRWAVEDDSWLNATTEQELQAYFLRTFTSDMTNELTEATWMHFENPTAFMHQAKVVKTKTMVLSQTAYTIASLELYNVSENQPQLEAMGTGLFHLTSKSGRWKIHKMEFDWEYIK
ncbi:MAG: hypothetical protein KGZ96_03510 [Clostridia bacterium]|nr:hypothetical protein [Clostridia bacterium]